MKTEQLQQLKAMAEVVGKIISAMESSAAPINLAHALREVSSQGGRIDFDADLMTELLEAYSAAQHSAILSLIALVEAEQAAPKQTADCKTCGGAGTIDDGEIDCYPNGEPYMNGPVKCIKDCPDCSPSPQSVGELPNRDEEILALHRRLAAETLRADQGWQRYEAANKDRNDLRANMVAGPNKALVEALKEYQRMYESMQPAGGWQGVYEGGVAALAAAGEA